MTLYSLKPTHIASFSFLCMAAAGVLLYLHDGPYWLMIVLFSAVAWSAGQWQRAAQEGPDQLPSAAFFVMLPAPFLSVAALAWSLVSRF